MLVNREHYNATRDAFSYPPIPDTEVFQGNRGYQIPTTIHGYEWSVSFGRWSALVTMPDGWHGFAWPVTFPVDAKDLTP